MLFGAKNRQNQLFTAINTIQSIVDRYIDYALLARKISKITFLHLWYYKLQAGEALKSLVYLPVKWRKRRRWAFLLLQARDPPALC